MRPMVSSTSGSVERGTTASCTRRSRSRRPSAPNAFLRPCHRRSRSRGSAAERTPREGVRSEEHTSELQSPCNLVCRLLLEKKKKKKKNKPQCRDDNESCQ